MARKVKQEITQAMKDRVQDLWFANKSNKAILDILKKEMDFQYSVAKIAQIIRELKDSGSLPEEKPNSKKVGKKSTKQTAAPKVDEDEAGEEDSEEVIETYTKVNKVNVQSFEDVENIDFEDEEDEDFDDEEGLEDEMDEEDEE